VADFLKVPLGDDHFDERNKAASVVVVQSASSDLVKPHGGPPDVGKVANDAAGRLEAIGQAAEQVYAALRKRLEPDKVEMEIGVGLSGEVGWFVAKSAVEGTLTLKLTWDMSDPK
jgi:hypothetical protein